MTLQLTSPLSSTTLDRTVGQLVAERPSRARVFESFKIDFCCGGKKPLRQACAEKGIDPDTVASVLAAFDEQRTETERDWTTATMTELADHIEETHHAYLKSELPRIEAMSAKVANRHGDLAPHLIELYQLFLKFQEELSSHMWKEENVLFPLCRAMDAGHAGAARHCGTIQNPIRVMVQEHDDAGDALATMRRLTNDFTPPPEACNTYRAYFDALSQLERDMHRHVHKENSILFPKALEAEARLVG